MAKFRTYVPSTGHYDYDDVHVGREENYAVYNGPYKKGDRPIAYIRAYCVRDALADARAKYGENASVMYA